MVKGKKYHFEGKIEELGGMQLVTHVLYVPIATWLELQADGVKRVPRVFVRLMDKELNMAIQSLSSGEKFIMMSLQNLKLLGLRPGQTGFEVELEVDWEETIPYHPDLLEAFEAAPEFGEAFKALNPGAQRGYCHYVNSAKREATRHDRIMMLIERAQHGNLANPMQKGK